jgi:hypothetical protein
MTNCSKPANQPQTFASLIAVFLAMSFTGLADVIEFEEMDQVNGHKLVARRDGVVVYELFSKGKDSGKSDVHRFYWKDKLAATILLVAGKATVQVYPGLPVSYSISLDEQQRPHIISIEDAEGNVVDGYLYKDGRLTPADLNQKE